MRLARLLGALSLVGTIGLSGASQGAGTISQGTCFGLAPTIVGTDGNDRLLGTDGPDVIVGLGGDDQLIGLGGDDALCGGPGNDNSVPGSGDDRVSGGGGGIGLGFLDYVSFSLSPGPVRVDLEAGTATGEGSDELADISQVVSTPYDDLLRGSGSIEFFYPAGGDDTIDGRGGQDFVGFDRPVNANLAAGSATGEGTDRLISVEGLIGSDLPDVLTGGRGSDYLTGGGGDDTVTGQGGDDRVFGDEGNDSLRGGTGGDAVFGNDGNDRVMGDGGQDKIGGDGGSDSVDGGAGADIVSYRESGTGVSVNLLVGRATGEGLDTLNGIEYANGSQFRDAVLGDARTNFIWGNGGSDRLEGGANPDFLDGGIKTSRLVPGAGRDYCINGVGASTCEIVGVPAIPPITDRVPAGAGVIAATSRQLRPGLQMPVPHSLLTATNELQSMRERLVRIFGGVETDANEGPLERWGILAPPLAMVYGSSGPGAFRYVGQPSCFAASSPYRTTVAPPELLEPVLRDGTYEEASWRGVLYRESRGKSVRVASTPWLKGVLQGEGYQTGIPRWLVSRGGEWNFAPRSFGFTVTKGTYVWAGVIEWDRTKKRVQHHISPHVVYTPTVQPDKDCRFG